MLRVVCLALALAVALASRARVEDCLDNSGIELDYECPSIEGESISIKGLPNDYVSIDCQGGILRCRDLPPLNISRDGALSSMSVSGCGVVDALPCALGALGARRVDTLSLWNLRAPLTASLVRGFQNLTTLLMFESTAQHTIPMEVLTSLPSLRRYRLREAHVELIPFPPLPLQFLELSMDGISELPPNVFQHLSQLRSLHLWKNKYQSVGNQSFTGLTLLQSLSLSDSTRSISPGAFSNTPNLKEIVMTRVNLDRVEQGVFTGLQHLETITMSNDLRLTVEPRAFAALPSLSALKLDWCSISTLPADAFSGSRAVLSLSLAHNELEALPSTLLKDQTALQRLHLEENKIKALPADLFGSTKKLVELNLDDNEIGVLPSQMFAGLAELKTVSINNNRLKTIADDAFQGARNLNTLLLSNNQLQLKPESDDTATATATTTTTATATSTEFDNGVYIYGNLKSIQSPFNHLLKLEKLDLSHNNISFIFDDWTTTLVQLKSLNLTYNRYTTIDSFDTAFLSLNIVVDLRHNNISSVILNDRLAPGQPSSSTGVALLDDNPLQCDCKLYGVVRRLYGYHNSDRTEVKLDFGDARCVAPRNLIATRISTLKPEPLVCNVDCPDGCQCDVRTATDTLELVCNTSNIVLPKPDKFDFKYIQLQLRNILSSFNTIPNNVRVLKLNDLGMVKLPNGIPPGSVTTIDLRNNSLSDVPVKLIERNIMLSLSANEFECDCWHAEELALLDKYKPNIEDFKNVTCRGGQLVSSLDIERLCTKITAIAVGGTLAIIGVLVAFLAVILYRYSLEVRVWLFAHGWCRCLLPEETMDRDKQYDAFLSFAHGDEKYVTQELLPTLDNEYRVCVHYRDWVVGDLIPTQIARSVESSRRTIIVLSQNFLESVWARLEFRAAHVQALHDGRARVIVILLQDVSNDVKLDDELKAYLSTNTYVKWGDPWFWDKLRYVLPRSGARQRVAEIRAERKTREAIDKFASYGLDVYLNGEGKLVNAAFKP